LFGRKAALKALMPMSMDNISVSSDGFPIPNSQAYIQSDQIPLQIPQVPMNSARFLDPPIFSEEFKNKNGIRSQHSSPFNKMQRMHSSPEFCFVGGQMNAEPTLFHRMNLKGKPPHKRLYRRYHKSDLYSLPRNTYRSNKQQQINEYVLKTICREYENEMKEFAESIENHTFEQKLALKFLIRHSSEAHGPSVSLENLNRSLFDLAQNNKSNSQQSQTSQLNDMSKISINNLKDHLDKLNALRKESFGIDSFHNNYFPAFSDNKSSTPSMTPTLTPTQIQASPSKALQLPEPHSRHGCLVPIKEEPRDSVQDDSLLYPTISQLKKSVSYGAFLPAKPSKINSDSKVKQPIPHKPILKKRTDQVHPNILCVGDAYSDPTQMNSPEPKLRPMSIKKIFKKNQQQLITQQQEPSNKMHSSFQSTPTNPNVLPSTSPSFNITVSPPIDSSPVSLSAESKISKPNPSPNNDAFSFVISLPATSNDGNKVSANKSLDLDSNPDDELRRTQSLFDPCKNKVRIHKSRGSVFKKYKSHKNSTGSNASEISIHDENSSHVKEDQFTTSQQIKIFTDTQNQSLIERAQVEKNLSKIIEKGKESEERREEKGDEEKKTEEGMSKEERDEKSENVEEKEDKKKESKECKENSKIINNIFIQSHIEMKSYVTKQNYYFNKEKEGDSEKGKETGKQSSRSSTEQEKEREHIVGEEEEIGIKKEK
jgi:hypothetical protein